MVILTGAPGSGKTTLINELDKRGFRTIAEAATDIILHKQALGIEKPWLSPNFIDDIVNLQVKRMSHYKNASKVFSDRSPICTYALCEYLKRPTPDSLIEAIDNMPRCQVFYIESLDTIENNHVRTITLEEAKAFGQLHKDAYKKFGYTVNKIKKACVEKRIAKLLSLVDGITTLTEYKR